MGPGGAFILQTMDRYPLEFGGVAGQQCPADCRPSGLCLSGKNIERVRKQREATRQPLQLAAFIEQERQAQLEAEKFNATPTIGADWNFIGRKAQDEVHAAREKEWLDQLQTDIYLEEAVHVLLDIINANRQAVAA